ncbi:tetratricopeptide repeat protein 34 [Geospiza fortis]|uniref:Tetratricopeptide repeat protein 34 n=1 Tax=Geospiza fortis TaxID=48883 RepID=A0A8N5EUR5_GEOFO|nr:tetratricopeptide repeat protein 34 [Geospiza fortis]
MSPEELAALLCGEGDERLSLQEFPAATAFYLAAFSCCAHTAVQRVNSMAHGLWERVVATLEAWCQGKAQIPKIQSRNLAVVSLSVGIAAIFLSTLIPNNVVASVYELEALLRRGCSEEVVRKCNLLLEGNPRGSMELLLLRALARVLSGTQVGKGILDYVQAFVLHQTEAAAYVCSRQREHLPQVVQAFSDHLSRRQEESPSCSSSEQWLGECYRFLAEVAPGHAWVCRARAAHLRKTGEFQECVAVCTKALEGLSAENLRGEDVLALLLERAAGYFFLGGCTQEMMQDLAAAFAADSAQAMKRFEELFSACDAEKIEEQARAALEGRFAAYREAVRARAELRGTCGTELLPPVIQTIQLLLHICPGSSRELRLLAAEQSTYHNTLLALRGFCSLHAQDHQGALQDFQRVIEHESPHPSSCIKALCGRGLIRISGGSNYLTALDYITACQLKLDETIFTIKSYVPWNQRGLLLKVLQEEGQMMLQKKRYPGGSSVSFQKKANRAAHIPNLEGVLDAPGVFQLASLLVELDSSDEASRILCADALYQMGRGEEAHEMLSLALSRNPQRAPVLARLALLQLKRGSVYDGNQLLRRLIRIGDSSCLLPVVDIFQDEDRKLLQSHCRWRALAILKGKQEAAAIREAIAHLSFAILAAGGYAEDCLLTRARCYGRLGQMKTAIFDFNAVLKEDPRNVQALSGRGFVHLALRQQKEAVQDLISALKVEAGAVIPAILSLKPEAQGLVTGWLLQHGRATLSELMATKDVPEETLRDLLTMAKALTKICRAAQHHIFYTDVLMANGRHQEALKHLHEAFGHCPAEDFARARLAVLQLQGRNVAGAAAPLSVLARRDEKDLAFLLNFVDTKKQQHLAQAAAQEGKVMMKGHDHQQALGYHSLAVLASRANPRYLRHRAACLMRMKKYEKALKDMDKVIQGHGCNSPKTQAGDHCCQGFLLLALAQEEAAVQHYMQALQLDEPLALGTITECPGRESLTKTFHKIAQYNFEKQRYEEAWKITDYGLKIDKSSELQKLKARLKREASSCSIH